MRTFLLCAGLTVFVASSNPVLAQCACDADVDGSTVVDAGDFDCVLSAVSNSSSALCPLADVNCDGLINACDLVTVQCVIDGGGAACCDVPCGACCTSPDPGSFCQLSRDGSLCLITTEAECVTPSLGFCSPGTYDGDGTTCDPSPCDCDDNGTPDGDDIAAGAPDCDDDGILDECEFPDPATVGACCIPQLGCAETTEVLCDGQGGIFSGICTGCDVQSVALILEPSGEVFVHVVGPPIDCDPVAPAVAAACTAIKTDPWVSSANSLMSHDFGAGEPIPADFFGAGSDPYGDVVALQGVPLGDANFPEADTLIERTGDPFDLGDPISPTDSTVPIEIVALSLESINPITVTFNGGMNPESWDLAVDLSTVTPPAGSLTALKTHCNGGTYTSTLNVQPRFTFTKVGGGGLKVFDTGTAGRDPLVLLQSSPFPWVHEVDPNTFVATDPCSDFHGGIAESNPTTICLVIPTISQWGLVGFALLLLSAATIYIGRQRRMVTR